MAEVAGLVIGGISLAALFDHCITIVKCFDSAASCDDDFQDAALMLTLLGGRLGRWERSLRNGIDVYATEEDGENAELWLKQIRRRLQEAEKFGSRYVVGTPPIAHATVSDRSKEVSRMLGQLRKVLKQEVTLSLAKKARWALFDQERMNTLVDKLDKLIGSLEVLFSSLHDQRAQLARTDAAKLLEPQEFGETLRALEALRIAAAKVDREFDVAAASSSHTYRNIDISDRAIVTTGDYYSEEWAKAGGSMGRGGSHIYDGIRISGDSNVNVGNVYGDSQLYEVSLIIQSPVSSNATSKARPQMTTPAPSSSVQPSKDEMLPQYSMALNQYRRRKDITMRYFDDKRLSLDLPLWQQSIQYGGKVWTARAKQKAEPRHKAERKACEALRIEVD